MSCDNCDSDRVASFDAKCSDCFGLSLGDLSIENDYVPGDFGIGGGDYIRMEYCLDCGKIQGDFPLEETELEAESGESDDDGDFDDGDFDDEELGNDEEW